MQCILSGNSLNGTNWNLAVARVSGFDIGEACGYIEVKVVSYSSYIVIMNIVDRYLS